MEINKIIESLNKITNINDLHTIKESIDSIEKKLNLLESAKRVNNFSYGDIKESFEALSPILFKTKDGRQLIRNYINENTNNSVLRNLHNLTESINKLDSEINFSFFITEACRNMSVIDSKELDSAKRNLSSILEKAYIHCGDASENFIATRNSSLNESIEYIATHVCNARNMKAYSSHVTNIAECIHPDTQEKLKESKNHEESFNKMKESCLSALDEAISKENNANILDKLYTLKEGVNKKQFNEKTLTTDIENLLELTKTIS